MMADLYKRRAVVTSWITLYQKSSKGEPQERRSSPQRQNGEPKLARLAVETARLAVKESSKEALRR